MRWYHTQFPDIEVKESNTVKMMLDAGALEYIYIYIYICVSFFIFILISIYSVLHTGVLDNIFFLFFQYSYTACHTLGIA